MVSTIVGLVIFGWGVVFALKYPPRWFVSKAEPELRTYNPGSPKKFPRVLIGLFAVLFIMTIVGFVWVVYKVLGGQLEWVADLAGVTSVVQGFVYGTAGLVIGLLSYFQKGQP